MNGRYAGWANSAQRLAGLKIQALQPFAKRDFFAPASAARQKG
jgi:hypothetical protein